MSSATRSMCPRLFSPATAQEGTEGIAILQHPSSKWYPAPWFTRDYGFFSPTPMYWPEDGEMTRLRKGETIELRYRVVIHAGDHLEAGIAEEFKKYAEQ